MSDDEWIPDPPRVPDHSDSFILICLFAAFTVCGFAWGFLAAMLK